MAELTISPDEIRSALDEFVSSYQPAAASMTEVGVVVTSGDGIARVEGLPSAMSNELLRFENGTMGIALNLDEREIGAVVLGDSEGIDEGSAVHGTGEVLSVPVGDGYLGRVVDAMGNPVDGLGEIAGIEGRRALELQAAGVMDRQEVREPLQTGIKAIDAMTPIGRGPQNRKDRHRDRHDHQPESQLGDRRLHAAGSLHLCGDRAEGIHRRRGAQHP